MNKTWDQVSATDSTLIARVSTGAYAPRVKCFPQGDANMNRQDFGNFIAIKSTASTLSHVERSGLCEHTKITGRKYCCCPRTMTMACLARALGLHRNHCRKTLR